MKFLRRKTVDQTDKILKSIERDKPPFVSAVSQADPRLFSYDDKDASEIKPPDCGRPEKR